MRVLGRRRAVCVQFRADSHVSFSVLLLRFLRPNHAVSWRAVHLHGSPRPVPSPTVPLTPVLPEKAAIQPRNGTKSSSSSPSSSAELALPTHARFLAAFWPRRERRWRTVWSDIVGVCFLLSSTVQGDPSPHRLLSVEIFVKFCTKVTRRVNMRNISVMNYGHY